MKTIIPIIGLVAILTGCRDDNMVVRLTDQKTGSPIAGVLVERYQPSSLFERIINPVGTTYQPLSLSEKHWTDSDGICTIQEVSSQDVYRLYDSTVRSISVNIGTNMLLLPPPTNATWSSWVYSFWSEGNSIKTLLEEKK